MLTNNNDVLAMLGVAKAKVAPAIGILANRYPKGTLLRQQAVDIYNRIVSLQKQLMEIQEERSV